MYFVSLRLHTGWSSGKPPSILQPEEKMAILEVIQRNEQLESAERQRVGRLVERVEKIKQRAAECGPRFCRLVINKDIMIVDINAMFCKAYYNHDCVVLICFNEL